MKDIPKTCSLIFWNSEEIKCCYSFIWFSLFENHLNHLEYCVLISYEISYEIVTNRYKYKCIAMAAVFILIDVRASLNNARSSHECRPLFSSSRRFLTIRDSRKAKFSQFFSNHLFSHTAFNWNCIVVFVSPPVCNIATTSVQPAQLLKCLKTKLSFSFHLCSFVWLKTGLLVFLAQDFEKPGIYID